MRLLHRFVPAFTRSRFAFLMLLALACALCGAMPAHAQWTQPTPEELSMTSQPEVPGAAAVYLYREEKSDDDLHQQSFYFRVKVLTEAGKEFANVRLATTADTGLESFTLPEFGTTVTNIQGRTIHSDGSVIPFAGKPYERTVENAGGIKVTETVFTLPDVEVGSILEYRYNVASISDNVFYVPTWYVQRDLFLRKGVFSWKSVDHLDLVDVDTGESVMGVSYTPTLPSATSVTTMQVPGSGGSRGYHRFDLTVHDVMPVPQEEYMPPLRSTIYRVNFYMALSKNENEFWKDAGRSWSKSSEHFIGSPDGMKDVVQTLVAPGDTDSVKLQKIYAAVMAMDNTSFTRQHETKEDKAQGLSEVKSVQDIWQRKRGTDDQLTLLFIALARAAGMKAYGMWITNRDTNLFTPALLTARQLDDDVAIVVLDGKEQFFDPGQKDCPFGQMAWKHTGAGGLRENPDGTTTISNTAEPPYTETQTQRIADLTLNDDGTVTGTLQISWTGAQALVWRQRAVRRDEEVLKHDIKDWMDGIVPSGIKTELTSLDNIDDYEKPLVASFTVQGTLGTATVKRLILPSQFFETKSKPLFPQPTRDVPIYFEHTGVYADAMRVKFSNDLQVESAPKDDAFSLLKLATYHSVPRVQPGVVLMRRTYVLGTAFFKVDEYSDVKTFYDKMTADDQQPLLLSIGAAPAAGAKTGP